jgi:hypothetical protein
MAKEEKTVANTAKTISIIAKGKAILLVVAPAW